MNKTVAVVGYGYVGKAVEKFFARKYPVVIYDPMQGHTDKEAINNASLAVICVPTPMGDDGAADVSALEETFAWIKTPLILIKSTIPPGTTKRLAEKYGLEDRLAFSPEYIGEGVSKGEGAGAYSVPFWRGYPHPTDMALHEFFTFGGSRKATGPIMQFFTTIAGPHARYMQTDSTTAELVKYMENTYLAMKVTFANEFYEVAQAYGVDYNELRELFVLDKRVDATHTLVFPENRGFGGKCLPKDVNSIAKASEKAGYTPTFINSILEANKKFRKEA